MLPIVLSSQNSVAFYILGWVFYNFLYLQNTKQIEGHTIKVFEQWGPLLYYKIQIGVL